MGFNNAGLDAFAERLNQRPRGVVVGANLGANKDTEDKAADYVAGLQRLAGRSAYFTVNISSPNTPGLRALQGREQLDDLLARIDAARPTIGPDRVPVFLKIAPDLIADEIGMIVEASLAHRIDGLIVSIPRWSGPRPCAHRTPTRPAACPARPSVPSRKRPCARRPRRRTAACP